MPENSFEYLPSLMMFVGMGIVCWLLMRSRLRRRATGLYSPASGPPQLKYNSQAQVKPTHFSGRGSLGAPAEVLQWQLDLHDLARELKGELDTKLIAVRSVTQAYDRASQRLLALIQVAERAAVPESRLLANIAGLRAQGWSDPQIANEVGLSETDIRAIAPISDSHSFQ